MCDTYTEWANEAKIPRHVPFVGAWSAATPNKYFSCKTRSAMIVAFDIIAIETMQTS